MYNANNMNRPEVEKMPNNNRFSQELLARAKEIAEEMILSGEQMKPLQVGEQQGALWVTTQEGQVIGSQSFNIGETAFYIGVKKEDD